MPVLTRRSQVFVAQQQLLVDEARHKGQKACPMESIAHDRKFMIAASTCSLGVREPPHRTGILTIRGEVERFASIAQAISYCGLTSAQHNSAGKEQRGPISKQRNKNLQTILIEAA